MVVMREVCRGAELRIRVDSIPKNSPNRVVVLVMEVRLVVVDIGAGCA